MRWEKWEDMVLSVEACRNHGVPPVNIMTLNDLPGIVACTVCDHPVDWD